MEEFQAEALIFASELPKPYTVTPETNSRTGKKQWCVRIIRQPDPTLSLIVGDCIHNLRSSLDHLIFALNQGRKKRKSAFPICSHPDQFTCKGKPAISGLPLECRKVVESLQPYQTQN